MHNIDINNDGMPTQKKNNINKFDVVLMNSNIEHPNNLLSGECPRLRGDTRAIVWCCLGYLKYGTP